MACGLRSLFVGLRDPRRRTTCASSASTRTCDRDYGAAIRRLHDLGRDGQRQLRLRHGRRRRRRLRPHRGVGGRAGHRDGHLPHPDAVPRHRACTSGWRPQGRILHRDWDLYDTRHVVFRPARLTPGAAGGRLLAGLPRLLPLAEHRARARPPSRRLAGRAAPRRLRRRAGRSSSRCGTGSSAPGGSRARCPSWRPCWRGSPAFGRARRARSGTDTARRSRLRLAVGMSVILLALR